MYEVVLRKQKERVEIKGFDFLSGLAKKRLPRWIAQLLIYSQLIQFSAAAALPVAADLSIPFNPNASSLIPSTYRPFKTNSLPNAGPLGEMQPRMSK
jgi:hypothetical protein